MMKYLIKNLIALAGLLFTFNLSSAQTASAIEQPSMKQTVSVNHTEMIVQQQIQQGENNTEKHFYIPEVTTKDEISVEKNSVSAAECIIPKGTINSKATIPNPKK